MTDEDRDVARAVLPALEQLARDVTDRGAPTQSPEEVARTLDTAVTLCRSLLDPRRNLSIVPSPPPAGEVLTAEWDMLVRALCRSAVHVANVNRPDKSPENEEAITSDLYRYALKHTFPAIQEARAKARQAKLAPLAPAPAMNTGPVVVPLTPLAAVPSSPPPVVMPPATPPATAPTEPAPPELAPPATEPGTPVTPEPSPRA